MSYPRYGEEQWKADARLYTSEPDQRFALACEIGSMPATLNGIVALLNDDARDVEAAARSYWDIDGAKVVNFYGGAPEATLRARVFGTAPKPLIRVNESASTLVVISGQLVVSRRSTSRTAPLVESQGLDVTRETLVPRAAKRIDPLGTDLLLSAGEAFSIPAGAPHQILTARCVTLEVLAEEDPDVEEWSIGATEPPQLLTVTEWHEGAQLFIDLFRPIEMFSTLQEQKYRAGTQSAVDGRLER